MAVNSLQGATDPISKGIVDAKGDIIAGTADNTIDRVAVGNNNTVLVADSSTSTGLKWSTLTSSQIPVVDVSAQTSSYTLAITDAGDVVEMQSASAQTVTVPADASVNFAIGTKIDILQTGAGECTISPAGGVTLNSEATKRKINAQWQAATLIKRGANNWVLIGALKA